MTNKLNVIIFSPDNIRLLKESPSYRRKYLNIDNTYNNIIAQNNKINVVRIKLDIILKDIFKQDLYPEFFYYVQMCFLHTNPHYKDWRKTFVNNKI